MAALKFDFTPDPKVLIALTHTPMQPLDALCELIDNCIDSFYAAKIQGIAIENPCVSIYLPSRKNVAERAGVIKIQDNGPGMTADSAEKAIKAGFSANNPYDTLGLFGMGFNIATGKMGNRTTLITARADSEEMIRTVIDLEKINRTKDYSLDVNIEKKGDFFGDGPKGHGTFIMIGEWWPDGNPNSGFVQKLVNYGQPKIREEIGHRYASILRRNEVTILVNDVKCEAYEHCAWSRDRYVTRKNGNIPAVIDIDKVIGSKKRCGKCTAIIGENESSCPSCGSNIVRTIEERVKGWIGIQRFDSETEFGIDLVRNGRTIRVGEKSAFFEFVDEFKRVEKDYPVDQIYGRIIGEINLDFVPVDFMKQDFQRTSPEWQNAMSYIRGNSSLKPNQPGADQNDSPMFRLFQAYRRVRKFGRDDMYMGRWDPVSRSAKRISRDIEEKYYKKFKDKEPGYYDDTEWWKLVESADQPPVEELPECPACGAQNLKEAEFCQACGEVLKGKSCINDECGMTIALSAETCPYCGMSQASVVLDPWFCKVCGTKNISTNVVCDSCRNPKGTNHPLSKEELLKSSDKIDELSDDKLEICYPDGKLSYGISVEVYSVRKSLENPITQVTNPLIIHKEFGKLSVFVDLSHPFFTNCALSKEQLIASEIALYLYEFRRDLASGYKEFNISNLTWAVLQEKWSNDVGLNFEDVYKDVEILLADIISKVKDSFADKASLYFDDLLQEQKKFLTNAMFRNNIPLEEIVFLKESGGYLDYVPYDFILNLYNEDPEMFFGGRIWNVSLAGRGAELLGEENVRRTRAKIINQYDNYLKDIIGFYENKYTDKLSIQRVKLSVEFLRKGLNV